MIVLCREVNVDTGEIAVYPIEKPVTDELLFILKIRSGVNPELRYFCVLKSRWEKEGGEYVQLLKGRHVTHRALEAIGGIEEL